jgi:hypothetical protein
MLICAAQKECSARDARSCVRTLKMLRRGSHPSLKRHHPNPGIPGWGDGGQRGIAFGHADLRCAEGMLCSRSSPLRSNPELRRGSRPGLKRHHPNPEIPGWGDGGQRGIAFGHADLRCAEGMLCSRSSPLRSNPELRRGSRPGLKRHHPNPEIPGWGDGGQRGIRTLGDIAATHAFQACSFDHSDICPWRAGN